MAWIWSIDPLRSLVGCSNAKTGEEFKVSYKQTRLDHALIKLQGMAGVMCLDVERRAILEKGRSHETALKKRREAYHKRRHFVELSKMPKSTPAKKTLARPSYCFECYDCDAKFSKERDAREHTRKAHGTPAGSPHSCGACSRGFESEPLLDRHVLDEHFDLLV